MAAVWPSIAVTDDSLVQAISDIRRAIGDEAHAVLRTVPRRGYKLMLPSGTVPAARWRRWWLVAAAMVPLVAAGAWLFTPLPGPGGVPLVAVLPFATVADDKAARRLADGLTGDVITDLARFPEIEVLAGGATEGYRGKAVDPRKVGAELGAGFIVDGSIHREAERMRISAHLFDTARGSSVWSDRWDRPAGDFFAIQSEIAEQIANRVGGGAGLVQERGRIAAHRKPPGNLNAYELYLLGTEKLERITRPDIEEAIVLLEQAVEIDPGFARAWIELSHSHLVLSYMGGDPLPNRAAAFAAAKRAVRLDPGDAEAHAVMGMRFGERGELALARTELDAALRLAPNAAEILTFYAMWASSFGEPERGAEMVDRVVRLDPNFRMWAARPFASAYFFAGRYEDALRMIDRLEPENYGEWMWPLRAGALAALDRAGEAEAAVREARRALPDLTIEKYISNYIYTDAERQRLVDTMRLAGFPACATPDVMGKFEKPVRLPECEQRAEGVAP